MNTLEPVSDCNCNIDTDPFQQAALSYDAYDTGNFDPGDLPPHVIFTLPCGKTVNLIVTEDPRQPYDYLGIPAALIEGFDMEKPEQKFRFAIIHFPEQEVILLAIT